MANLNTSILSSVPIVAPPDDILAAFAREVDDLEHLRVARHAENATLAAIRDALLPRLLSGELPIPAAMRIAETA
jgi:type I restriction enzyme S subunit